MPAASATSIGAAPPRLRWLIAATLAGLPLFVIPVHEDEYLMPLFDACHLCYFGLLGGALMSWPRYRTMALTTQLALGAALAFAAGGAIELAQIPAHRDASLDDVWRDTAGLLIAVTALSPVPNWPAAARRALRVATLMAALAALQSAALRAWDYVIVRTSFPVFGDFETATDVRRWRNGTLATDIRRSGHGALRIVLSPQVPYPGTALKGPKGDWQRYARLHLSLYRTGTEPLRMTIEVADKIAHDHGSNYFNRFQRQVSLRAGWNDIDVPVTEIARAPRNRRLALNQITEFSLFSERVKDARVIYLDDVRLEH